MNDFYWHEQDQNPQFLMFAVSSEWMESYRNIVT